MPFTPQTKNPGDLVKSQDWNALGLAISELFKKFALVGGHRHTGTDEDAPQITAEGLAKDAITPEKIQNGAVTADKLQSDPSDDTKRAVGTTHLRDGTVSIAKLNKQLVGSGQVSIEKGGEIAIPIEQITGEPNAPNPAFYLISIAHYYSATLVGFPQTENFEFVWSEGIETRRRGMMTLLSNYRVVKVKSLSTSTTNADIAYKIYRISET